jgi:hypothetical protein
LHSQMANLQKAELRKCWANQRPDHSVSSRRWDLLDGHLRTRVFRVGLMMPERERLARNISSVASLQVP